jgi:hypothetical protein
VGGAVARHGGVDHGEQVAKLGHGGDASNLAGCRGAWWVAVGGAHPSIVLDGRSIPAAAEGTLQAGGRNAPGDDPQGVHVLMSVANLHDQPIEVAMGRVGAHDVVEVSDVARAGDVEQIGPLAHHRVAGDPE